MRKRHITGWAVTFVLPWILQAMGSAALAGPMLIDDFSLPNPGEMFFLQGKNPTPVNRVLIEQEGEGILGGQRDVLIEVLGTPNPLSAGGIVGYDALLDVGHLQLATFGQPGTRVMLQYDGVDSLDSLAMGLVSADDLGFELLTGGPIHGVLMSFLSVDAADPRGLDVQVRVKMDSGEDFEFASFVPDGKEPFDHLISFGNFATSGTPVPGRIDSLTFSLNDNGTPNVDFELDALAFAVPEPSILAMLGLGSFVLLATRRRRRKQPNRPLTNQLL